jgi:flagellar hook-associated protein 2
MATAPITFSGLNGFDFSSVINAEIQAESAPMQALQAKQTTIQNTNSALSTLGTQISQLESTISALSSQTSFTNVTANSSDTTIAGVSAGSAGIAGTYDVVVGSLAKAQLTSSTNGYSHTTDTVADGGQISFTIGGQTTTPITISAATSLSDLANQINAQNSGVFATVVNDGTNNKLAIQSRQTGKANGFIINSTLTLNGSTTGALAFAANQSLTTGNAQIAADASLTVNNLGITSSSNTVTNAISGATLSLTKAGETLISVTPDYTTLQNNLSSLVSQYNNLAQYVKAQSAFSNGKGGPLANNSTVRQIMQGIRNQLLTASGNGNYQYLAQTGIQFNADGTLGFNQSTFQSAVNTSPTDIQTLFIGNGSNGLFNHFLSTLQADDATAGVISTTTTANQKELQGFANEISSQQQMLNNRQAALTKMYAAADQAMTRLRASGQSLSQFGTTSLF